MVNQTLNFDKVVKILENPVRREILKRLSEEPQYILQLSKQMAVSQQAVTKHMKILEEAGIVHSVDFQHGQGGAPRKYYYLKDFYSVKLEVGPGLFLQSAEIKTREEIHALQKQEIPVEEKIVQETVEKLNSILEIPDKAEMVLNLFHLIHEIRKKADEYDTIRTLLMKLRALAQSELHKQIVLLSDDYRRRQVLYRMVDDTVPFQVEDPYEIAERLSEDLDMRVKEVEFIIEDLWDNEVFRRLFDPFNRLK